MSTEGAVIQLSTEFPAALGYRLHLSICPMDKCNVVFVASKAEHQKASDNSSGTMVAAYPRTDAITTFFATENTRDFSERLARILARRTNKPAYVTCRVNFSSAALGGALEEEKEAFARVVEIILEQVRRPRETHNPP